MRAENCFRSRFANLPNHNPEPMTRMPSLLVLLISGAFLATHAGAQTKSPEVEKKIKELVEGGKIVKFSMLDSKEKDYKKGLNRYKEVKNNVYNELVEFLSHN